MKPSCTVALLPKIKLMLLGCSGVTPRGKKAEANDIVLPDDPGRVVVSLVKRIVAWEVGAVSTGLGCQLRGKRRSSVRAQLKRDDRQASRRQKIYESVRFRNCREGVCRANVVHAYPRSP